jgi:Amt family ammonium transporter
VPSIIPKSTDALTGLFYGGGFKVLAAQCVGSFIVCAATFVSAMAMFKILNMMRILRVSREGELVGLDLDQHGISAYPQSVWTESASLVPTPAAAAMSANAD